SKALMALKRGKKIYKNGYRKDPNLFHDTHYKFIYWTTDYMFFQQLQALIASADREKSIVKFDLKVMEALEYFLINYQENRSENSIVRALNVVQSVKNRYVKGMKEFEWVIPELERQVEDNEYFKQNNYFEDVDELGYKNLSWE
ncbi:MAG: hypothetical protein ABSE83_08920, partial [Methanobacterium sp.]